VEDGFLNTEPLSKMISLGMPCVANIDLRAVTVVDLVDVVAVLVISTSIHLKYMCP